MKSIFFIFSMVFFTINAQSNYLNKIEINEIQLKGKKLFSLSIQEVEMILGEPDTIVRHYDSIVDEAPFYELFYGNSFIQFQNDRIIDFELLDNSFKLFEILIGTEERLIKSCFPKSYNYRYTPSDVRYEIVPISIFNNNLLTDSYIHILIENNKVRSIEFWQNN